MAFSRQSEDYFGAASGSDILGATPVLIYYGCLNLAKALALTEGVWDTYGRAQHGITQNTDGVHDNPLLETIIEAYPSTNPDRPNVFDDFLKALGHAGLTAKTDFPLSRLWQQLVPGHRLWCAATGENEQFLKIERVDFLRSGNQLWCVVRVDSGSATAINLSRKSILDKSGLSASFRRVASRKLFQKFVVNHWPFEQTTTVQYGHRPSDHIPDLVAMLRPTLWSLALTSPPYRKYYLHLPVDGDRISVIPQLASMYATAHYLSTVTRYSPEKMQDFLAGPCGTFLEETVGTLPNQFIYLMASEFAKQEISRAAIL